MTYRERREAKADRLRGWAEKRETDAAASLAAEPAYRDDWAFITQPGHIPARSAMNRRDERRHESLTKAASMSARADSIEAQAAHAIYSDDDDAIPRLRERIAGWEAERARIKAYNASCRKGARNVKLLDEKQQAELASIARVAPYQLRDNGAAPAYWSANLSGNINRQRKRLAQLERAAGQETPTGDRG